MSEKLVIQALQTAAIAAVAASNIPTMPIKALLRTGFQIPENHRYWELVHIPNNPTGEFWGAEKTYRGIFNLILHWGLDDAGAYAALDHVASVSAYFYKGRSLENGGLSVKITERPDLTGAIEVAPQALFPVSVWYNAFQP